MVGVFKQKSPGNVAILFLFGLFLKLPLFLYPKAIVTTDNDGRLYRWAIEMLGTAQPVVYSVISFALIYIQALMINHMLNEYRLIIRQSFLAGMSFMLITSLLPEWNYLSAPLVANTLIVWLFIYLFRLYNTPNIKGHVYNIGLIAGISSYIYFPSIVFVLCILLGMMILKPFRLNEIILFIMGCLTPYYFHIVYLFLGGRLNFINFFPHVSVRVPFIRNSIPLAASTLLLALPFLIGGYYVQNHLRKMLIQVRKNWSILLLYLLLAFFVPFVNSAQSFHTWVLVTAPFAAFHACAYFYARRWLSLAIFIVTLCFVLYQEYWTTMWQ